MSFSADIKSELIKISELPDCCRHVMAYGMLLFGRSFNEQEISIMTDNPSVADKYTELSFAVAGIQASRYISEAGKTTVSFSSASDRKKVLDCFSNSGNEKVMRIDRGNLRNESEAEFEYDMQDSINCCNAAFLRGAFLSCGTCSDPNKSYHIEFIAPYRTVSLDLLKILTDYGLNAKHMLRRGINVIYIKDSTSIEELLTLMGAQMAAMEIMNIKIYKDVRNLTNRRNNFENANLTRTVYASYDQVESIQKLKDDGVFPTLTDDLKMIAQLRIDNPDSSLREIGDMCDPPLSRSAVNYRLKRLMDIAEKLEK
ncbi:MAG: DNA-binding protein WhiA [Clostridia bacterium]|nr:DNA-binding protein WhiA [Clostridia bacterium]